MAENAKFAEKARIKPLPVSYRFRTDFKLKEWSPKQQFNFHFLTGQILEMWSTSRCRWWKRLDFLHHPLVRGQRPRPCSGNSERSDFRRHCQVYARHPRWRTCDVQHRTTVMVQNIHRSASWNSAQEIRWNHLTHSWLHGGPHTT